MKTVLLYLCKGTGKLLSGLIDASAQLHFKFLLWVNNVTYGDGLRIYGACPCLKVALGARCFSLGAHVTFNSYAITSWYSRMRIFVEPGAKLVIGDYSGLNGCLIYCKNAIKIGSHVNIGGGTRIYDTNFHSLHYLDRRNVFTDGVNAVSSPIYIEDDVFIGTNCIIGKGVTIGARSVIAAGSVVVKDIPSDCIAGGNPCKVIKSIM